MATETDESRILRKKLLKLDKNELARKCKKKSLASNGSKMDMVDRLIAYNEENGGVTGAREGSNKNKKKTSNATSKKGGKSGGGGGGSRAENDRKNNNGGSRGGGGDGAVSCNCYCPISTNDDDDNDNNSQTATRRLIGAVLGVICLILFIVAIAVNSLSSFSDNDISVVCRWNEIRGCRNNNVCTTISFVYDCDECELDGNEFCGSCKTKAGGSWWLALNILSLIILLIGIIGILLGLYTLKGKPFAIYMKICYIFPALFSFFAVIAWVVSNDYSSGSCYDTQNDLGLGASNIIDIVNGILLLIAFILVW
eukprot:549424_1